MDVRTIKGFEQLKLAQRFSTKLLSGYEPFDNLLHGGLQEGELSEWGLPWGQGLRELILPFIRYAQEECHYWVLWVSGHDRAKINPWAWHARSIQLDTIRFVVSPSPLDELRAIFLSDFFRVIVLDQIPNLSEEDCQHLARQARRSGLTILILRDGQLDTRVGNIWTRLRLNAERQSPAGDVRIDLVKGRRPQSLQLPLSALQHYRGTKWA